MSSLQSEILARKKQSIIRLTALCRYELIKYLVYDIATSFNVLCVLLLLLQLKLSFCVHLLFMFGIRFIFFFLNHVVILKLVAILSQFHCSVIVSLHL